MSTQATLVITIYSLERVGPMDAKHFNIKFENASHSEAKVWSKCHLDCQ